MEEEFKKVNLIELLRTFKKEGLDNFVVIRKEKLKKNFIPKNKIREKIEEYKGKTDCKYCNNACDSYGVCTVLKELLGEDVNGKM